MSLLFFLTLLSFKKYNKDIKKERKIMTGLTQQEQEQNSPFTLEAVLEEESDINTNHINDALPFDKCLKADTQADEEEKKRRLYVQIAAIKNIFTRKCIILVCGSSK